MPQIKSMTQVTATRNVFLDKTRIRQIVTEQNEKMEFVVDRTATPEQAQALVEESLRANGLRPEDNIFSCGIIAARRL